MPILQSARLIVDPENISFSNTPHELWISAMTIDIDVVVHEVGPRDGLQAVNSIYPTEGKLEWIEAEAAAGVHQIQVGSFVPPKLLPQMADSDEVVRRSKQIPGLRVSALVPNLKGAQNAVAAGVDILNYVLSVSEEHNRKNVRRSLEDSLDDFSRIVQFCNESGSSELIISGGMATCFGCTMGGKIPESEVFRVAESLIKRGAHRIGLADTVGYANPAQVSRIFTEVLKIAGDDVEVGAHFHDTRGLGLANVYAAVEAGVREFDSTLGGLGGCPWAPGATGNIVTEDLVFLLESMGLKTGVDLEKLMLSREIMVSYLDSEPSIHGTYALAGPPKGFVPASAQT